MFDEENKQRAEAYVNRHFLEMKDKIEQDGYFVYDEYETIYRAVGRLIPDILNSKLNLSGDEELHAREEMIQDEGGCGIIVQRELLEDTITIRKILTTFYKNKRNADL